MNLLVTSYDLGMAFISLDIKRRKIQFLDCCNILSTVLRLKPEWHNLIEYGDDFLLKPSHTDHPVIKWAMASPQNLFIIAAYITINPSYLRGYDTNLLRKYAKRIVDKVISCNLLPGFDLDLEKISTFYNHTIYKEEELIVAYRKHLIDRWKGDLRKEALYHELKAKGENPRRPYKLSWGGYAMPEWAESELKGLMYAK